MEDKEKRLKDWQKKMHAYKHAAGLLSYDAATSMPSGASQNLGETLKVLSAEMYAMTVDPEFKSLLHSLSAEKEKLSLQTRREVEELEEEQQKMERVPEALVLELEEAENEGNHYWEIAKKNNDYPLFKPYLKKLITLRKQYAGYINPGGDVYDTLMNQFEKGMTKAQMDPFFTDLKHKIVPLLQKIQQSSVKPEMMFLQNRFDIGAQKKLSEYIMEVMGIDSNRCILRETEHPFTTEFSKNDVRITTKYAETDLLSNLFSVIHESGHAMYELSIGDELMYSVLGEGASTAIHESQSRLWENYIGRSRSFCNLIFPKVKELFPDQMKNVQSEDFYKAVNAVQPSLIRTDADELTYSIHVMIRYEIEKKIFADELTADELPDVWNQLYKEYLGIDVPDDSRGILQDAHWAGGAFGYFPSYALGTAYSAQIMKSLGSDVDVSACCKIGDFSPVRQWLTEKIYKYGMILRPREIIEKTCGASFEPSIYTDYLAEKYTALYEIK